VQIVHSLIRCMTDALAPLRILLMITPIVTKDSLPIRNDMIDLYFSASPGLLASIDDYYIIHGVVANLAVTETSLDMYNQDLVQFIYPSTMLCWARYVL
jgi:hypothetical protein